MIDNIFKKSMSNFLIRKYISIVVVLILFVICGVAVYISSQEPPKYNLIYYYKNGAEIKVVDGKIIEPKEDFFCCTLLNTDDFSKRRITIEEINNLDLIISDVSPDGFRIMKKQTKQEPMKINDRSIIEPTGLVDFDVYLYKNFIMSRIIGRESMPSYEFVLIGWVAK